MSESLGEILTSRSSGRVWAGKEGLGPQVDGQVDCSVAGESVWLS